MKIIYLILICFVSKTFAQNDSTKIFIADRYDYKVDRTELVKKYADSIDNIKTVKKIPEFIFDECLEYDIFLRQYNSIISVREEILSKVNNLEAIKIILNLKDDRLKGICRKYPKDSTNEIKDINISFYQIFLRRYNQLLKK